MTPKDSPKKISKADLIVEKDLDFQSTLFEMACSMVGLKRPERLLRMMTRFIQKELSLHHASLVYFDYASDSFVFIDSRGQQKIPLNLIRFDFKHPLVEWFKKYSKEPHGRHLDSEAIKKESDTLQRVFFDLNIDLAVAGYEKQSLIGMFLFGPKSNGESFSIQEKSFFQILIQNCVMAMKAAQYQKQLEDQNRQLEEHIEEIEYLNEKDRRTFKEVLTSLAQEVYAKDAYTFGHIKQVERLGIMTAEEMKMDLSARQRDILSAGLVLHDVGKIGIPDNILNKPASLDEDEWVVMKTHAEKGAEILEPLTDFKEVAEIVRCHHENYDGTGYPRGIEGEAIPIQSRIVSVVDAFHAIVSTRCYRKGRPVQFAFEELKRCAGTQFDPDVVKALIQAVSRDMKKRGVDSERVLDVV